MKRIGIKIWIGMMGLVVFIISLLWLFQIVFLENFYLSLQIDKLEKKTLGFVEQINLQDKLEDSTEVLQEIENFVFTYHTTVEILDSGGEVVQKLTETQEQQGSNQVSKAMSQAAPTVLSGTKIETIADHPRFGNKYLILGFPLEQGGAFLVYAPMAPVSDTADILKRQLVIITLLLLVAASTLAWLISRRLSKPISHINKATQAIAKGQWDIEVDLKSQDEIGQLGRTIHQMAGDLKRTDLLRKELIGNISHELRTPLSLIKGYTETIRDIDGDIPEKRERYLQIILDESDRLARLIDDIMQLSQLEAGVMVLHPEVCAIYELLQSMQVRFQTLADASQIQIHIDCPKEINIEADVDRLQQVFINLIGNALNYTQTGGHIYLTGELVEQGVLIKIRDDGLGIDADDLEVLWDRYYKGKNTALGKRIGSGLGLAIVKNIFIWHQMPYGVESQMGQGTTFWFILKKVK